MNARTTDTQWRHKSKISEKLGRCERQNMLRSYLKIWEWEWIFGHAVKAIFSLGIRSLCLTCKLGWNRNSFSHGLRTPREEKAFTARPKIHSHSQIFRYGQSIFCLPLRPNFSDIFDLCLHWKSVVRVYVYVHKTVKTKIIVPKTSFRLTENFLADAFAFLWSDRHASYVQEHVHHYSATYRPSS